MPSSPFSGLRAGFWRRVLAFLLDCLSIGAVVSVAGTLAFSLTGGWIQTGGVGISFSRCTGPTPIPADLEPPPPENSNYAEVCSGGAFPFAISRQALVVGRRTTVSPGRTSFTSRPYPLSTTGTPIAAVDLTWVGQLSFIAYIVVSLVSRGRTLGMRLLRIRLLTLPAETAPVGVPLRRLLIRVGIAVVGFLPFALMLAWVILTPTSTYTGALVAAAILLWFLWVGYNVVLIARKDDPVYDSVAGLAVLVDPN